MRKRDVRLILEILFNELYENTGSFIKPGQLAKKYGLDEYQERLLHYYNSQFKKFYVNK